MLMMFMPFCVFVVADGVLVWDEEMGAKRVEGQG
jgi:hypothetical protein